MSLENEVKNVTNEFMATQKKGNKWVLENIDIKKPTIYKKKLKRKFKDGGKWIYHTNQIYMSINKKDNTKANGNIVVMDLKTLLGLIDYVRDAPENNIKVLRALIEKKDSEIQ